ncbi:hypothetical protein FOA52_014562 [Chlamydomonas sp. UWO 241]|nr:hypothetical protein FOA52_014562 [Chlamydomonas sp. UWO 241]
MSMKMMRSGVVSRASTVRVMAKTSAKETSGSASRRQQEVAAYLETLPGCGKESGPFEGVFDPLSLSAGATLTDVRRWRESELTHGRVAMLAALGFITGEQLQDFPLFYNFDGEIQGQAINQFQQVKQGFWEPLLIAIGLAESYRVSVGWATPTGNNFNALKDDYEMGELGFDPLGLVPEDSEELKALKTKELNNGRLAMIAIAGFVLQEVAEPGVEIFEHFFFDIEKEIDLELDDVEKIVGIPPTFTPPSLPAYEQDFKKSKNPVFQHHFPARRHTMSMKMMRSGFVSRASTVRLRFGVVSRASTVRVRAEEKLEEKLTEKNAPYLTAAQQEAAAAAAPRRQKEVAAYLETLPGCGKESGPFEGVFDPLSLSAGATLSEVRRWRESELTHGRVAMLAALGFITGEQLQDFPLFYNFDGQIEGQAINQFQQVKQGFWEPLLIAIGLAESYRVSIGWATPVGNNFNALKDDYKMGELGFDPLGLLPNDPDEIKALKTKELNNGRLAMIAIAGFVLQELAEPGVEIFEHLFFNTEKEVVLQLDDVEKAVGIPPTFTPPSLPDYQQKQLPMSMKMMRSGFVSRTSTLSRTPTVRVMAAGETSGSASRRQQEVAAYLATQPGQGEKSGPFKGVWDPLSLSSQVTLTDVRRWRESELTHGRVAMLAALGFITGEQLQDFPLFYNFDGQIEGQAINQFQQVKQGFWEPLLIAIGLAESYRVSIGWATPVGNNFNALKDDYDVGNLYFDPLGLAPEDDEELFLLKTKELNNGRLAMIAIAGFVLQELAEPGVEIFEHLFFNAEVGIDKEIDVIEKDLGLPQTVPIPELPSYQKK